MAIFAISLLFLGSLVITVVVEARGATSALYHAKYQSPSFLGLLFNRKSGIIFPPGGFPTD
jgi:hypothetical protein